MKLVLASQNEKKLKEMNDILSHLGIEVCLQSQLGVHVEVEETGDTFEENSRLKAQAVMEATGMPAIADDSGLCVDALGGAPGVYSARYGGPAWTTRDGIDCFWRICGGRPLAPPNSSPSSPAASPTGMCSPPEESARVPSPMPPRGRAALAMIPCSSCPSGKRPLRN